jgi:hypothetical protein
VLTTTLPGSTVSYTTTVPYAAGMTYFALKTQNNAAEWSDLSNNAFWPHLDIYLPLIRK